jgi:hypothetical protein
LKYTTLDQVARSIRSKNAGAYFVTLEILFNSEDAYRQVKESGAISRESIAEAFGIDVSEVISLVYYDPGLGVKANLRRTRPSGGPGETDVYGCQQYAPLLSLRVPLR